VLDASLLHRHTAERGATRSVTTSVLESLLIEQFGFGLIASSTTRALLRNDATGGCTSPVRFFDIFSR
jgi:hypothetical protein